VKLRGRHLALELRGVDDLAEEAVGRKQHLVVEEDVVDADHALLAQHDVARLCVAAVHGEPEPVVRIVVEVGAGRDDPVDEPRLDERDERRDAQARGRQRPGQRQPDGHLGFEHLVGEELRRLA
jgi:hypothetical protein